MPLGPPVLKVRRRWRRYAPLLVSEEHPELITAMLEVRRPWIPPDTRRELLALYEKEGLI